MTGSIASFRLEAADALRQQIAVLDGTGTIVAVNRAWREFGEQNIEPGQPLPRSVGVNYLAVCQAPSGSPGHDDGSAAYAGIRAVLDGQRPSFVMEYPCHSPNEQRWFRLTVTPLRPGKGAVCSHQDISDAVRTDKGVIGASKGAGEAASSSAVRSPPTAKPGLHVLCVDDNRPLLRPIEVVLRKRGYQVTTYDDPVKALEAVRAHPDKFDIVVTDYNMPGLSGLELLREVLALRPDLPTGILSGFFDDGLREKASALGVKEQISKGDMRDLYEAVARLALAAR